MQPWDYCSNKKTRPNTYKSKPNLLLNRYPTPDIKSKQETSLDAEQETSSIEVKAKPT